MAHNIGKYDNIREIPKIGNPSNMNPSDLPDVPPQYFESDIPAYIQTLLVNKYMGRYRDYNNS